MDAWAVVEYGQPLEKIRLELPEPKNSEVLIEVTHSGVCHSDLHFWEGYYDLGGGNKFRMSDRGVKLPHAMGHEVLGNVAKLGPMAQGVKLGDRRIVYPWVGCGECWRCRAGEDNLCDKPESIGMIRNGGMAKYVLVKDPKCLVDPGDVDPAVACTFGCSGVTVLCAIQKLFPVSPELPVVLMGAGGLGLTAISMLNALGYLKVVSVDITPKSREAAVAAGAVAAIDGKAEDARAQILSQTGGPVCSVLDFVNSSDTAALAFSVLAKGGKMVQVGLLGGELNLSLVGLVAKAATIIGSSTGTVKHLEEVTRLAQQKRLARIPITTMPKDQANEALTLLRQGKVVGRLVLTEWKT
jgi:alcohol dehydrogenase/propanol-preferring alcohol dehydrogenase